jgi:uncharacterized protein (UPF0333 family)
LGKKGQADLSETLLVLLVVVFLLVSGIFVYYMFFYRSLDSIGSDKADIDNLVLLHAFASSPEAKCDNEDCVDVIKLFGFKNLATENKEYYIERFGKKKIIIENVYPELNENLKKIECSSEKFQQSDFPNNCGFFVVYDTLGASNKASISLPVSLFYSSLNEYRIGVLRIQYED